MPPKKSHAPKKQKWQEIAQQAQQDRDASLALAEITFNLTDTTLPTSPETDSKPITLLNNLPPFIREIITLSPADLVTAITSGTYTATHVLDAFSRTAILSQKTTNSITELLHPHALARAALLDTHQLKTGEPVGPLHGLPVSIKSHIGIADCRLPSGYIAWYSPSHIAAVDALVVKILERAGAVIHARTTEPQGMMQLECASNLYGVTLNPYHTKLSSGGSSGGEAALLAMRGSCIGIGSDVGGSIRVPAAACGIFGLKPTGFRVPTTGWASTPPGADPIPTVLGPMCASLDGVEMFMQVVLAAEPWTVEPALVPLPWRTVDLHLSVRKLRVGVAWHDGTVLPHPPITRTLQDLVNKMGALEEVEVVDFPLYKLDEAWAIASSLYFTDGGAADRQVMTDSGEPILPLFQWILDNPGVKNLTREELEYWLEEREAYRLEYADHWNRTGRWCETDEKWVDTVDVLICPVAPGVATRHGTAKYWPYSAVWNLLDYPALVFPAGRVDQKRDKKEGRGGFMSLHDGENWELYDADLFDGMPVGLQIVGRRFEDEKIVAVVKYLQDRGCLGL